VCKKEKKPLILHLSYAKLILTIETDFNIVLCTNSLWIISCIIWDNHPTSKQNYYVQSEILSPQPCSLILLGLS